MLGEGFTPEDEEDSSVAEVSAVYVYQARYRVPVGRATAGNLVLIEGVDATITKTATLVAEAYDEPVCIFRYNGAIAMDWRAYLPRCSWLSPLCAQHQLPGLRFT